MFSLERLTFAAVLLAASAASPTRIISHARSGRSWGVRRAPTCAGKRGLLLCKNCIQIYNLDLQLHHSSDVGILKMKRIETSEELRVLLESSGWRESRSNSTEDIERIFAQKGFNVIPAAIEVWSQFSGIVVKDPGGRGELDFNPVKVADNLIADEIPYLNILENKAIVSSRLWFNGICLSWAIRRMRNFGPRMDGFS